MGKKKFKFQLQPALDKAVAEQEKAEAALRDARRQHQEAEAKLTSLQATLDQTRQQIRQEHDRLVQPAAGPQSGLELMQRDEFIKALGIKSENQRQAVEQQRTEVVWCQQRVDRSQENVKQAMMQVRAMERLRDKALEDHRKAEERALQEDIDEAGMQGYMRRQ